MASVFTKIMVGELPARFVHSDEKCTAFLTIAPISRGHTLVVPRQEVDRWTDLNPDLAAHLMTVAQRIAKGIDAAFSPTRVGLVIAGLEVPHTHLHLIGFDTMDELSFERADPSPDPADLDDAAERLREALTELRPD
jgi:histidine triad (HIT) family protein